VLLSCLLNAYPENGLELFNTYDYWTCKELIDIANNSRIPPEIKIQEAENVKFNAYLDKYSRSKFGWLYLTPLNLWQIKATKDTNF